MDWAETSKNWVDDRLMSTVVAVQNKIKRCLSQYVSKTDRWDLESLKLDLTEYKTKRANLAMTD